MKKSIVLTIVILVLVLAGFYLFIGKSSEPQNFSNIEPNETQDDQQEQPVAKESKYQIVYTDNGYLPSELKIKVGNIVIFKNENSKGLWTSSAMHPSHMMYSGTSLSAHCPDVENDDFDQCTSSQPNQSWSFTFTKTGIWGYHNHANAKHFGKIIVE